MQSHEQLFPHKNTRKPKLFLNSTVRVVWVCACSAHMCMCGESALHVKAYNTFYVVEWLPKRILYLYYRGEDKRTKLFTKKESKLPNKTDRKVIFIGNEMLGMSGEKVNSVSIKLFLMLNQHLPFIRNKYSANINAFISEIWSDSLFQAELALRSIYLCY